MRTSPALAVALAVALAMTANVACLRSTEFKCTSNDQCGASGTCEADVGFCAFPDPQCTGGDRFGDSAGQFAGQCVGAQQLDGGIDSGGQHDGPPIDGSGSGSGSDDVCGTGYAPIASFPGHEYKVVPTASWNAQESVCGRASPLSYLAIPDGSDEVTALDTLITINTYWVGVENVGSAFTTVLGTTQSFLPWAPGQPNTTANSHCVEVSAAGSNLGLFDLDKCSDSRPAICECEP